MNAAFADKNLSSKEFLKFAKRFQNLLKSAFSREIRG